MQCKFWYSSSRSVAEFAFRFGFDQEMDANVTANCVHPGIVRTRLNRDRDGLLTGIFTAHASMHTVCCHPTEFGIGLTVQ